MGFLERLDGAEKRDDARLAGEPVPKDTAVAASNIAVAASLPGTQGGTPSSTPRKVKGNKKDKAKEKKEKKGGRKGSTPSGTPRKGSTPSGTPRKGSMPLKDSDVQSSSNDPATSQDPAVVTPAAAAPAADGPNGTELWRDKAGIHKLREYQLIDSRLLLHNLFRPMHWWRNDSEQANLARRPEVASDRRTLRRMSVRALRDRVWLSSKSLPAPNIASAKVAARAERTASRPPLRP